MLGAQLRRTGFWLLDALKGGSHRAHYLDIKKNADKDTQEKLATILRYARENVPFYENIPSDDLSAFPVMTKLSYRAAGKEATRSQKYLEKSLHTVCTSGSTGTPFEVVQNPNKRCRVVCDLLCCHESLGWCLGDRYVFIRNWVSNYNSSFIKSLMQNVHFVNITGFDDKEKAKLTCWLKKHKNTIIFGYSSSVHEYAVYLEQKSINAEALKVRMLVCDSDALTPAMAARIQRVFNCPVHNRYDNEENGLLAICRHGSPCFELNTSSLYFELLQLDSDSPVQPGEIGRVVVTDLYNQAQPLIRYDTGDLAISDDLPGQIRTIRELSGRSAAVLTNSQGRPIGDGTVAVILEPYTTVSKFQLIQHKQGSYTMKYVGTLNQEEEKDVLLRMRYAFGADAQLNLVKVDDIPCGSNGKHRSTIRES